jgi:hypothetical protein
VCDSLASAVRLTYAWATPLAAGVDPHHRINATMTGPHAVSRMLPTRRAAVTVPALEQRERRFRPTWGFRYRGRPCRLPCNILISG